MPIPATPYIWFNGKLVPWEKATVHVLTHALHYGSSVFEGVRAYQTPRGLGHFPAAGPHPPAVRFGAHLPHGPAVHSRSDQRGLPRGHQRQRAGARRVYPPDCLSRLRRDWRRTPKIEPPIEVAIAAWEWGKYLGHESEAEGVDVCVSSWQRVAPNTLPAMAKAGGNYLSSQLIGLEARRLGFAEGIGLTPEGLVSEGSGENLFLVKDGVLLTPGLAHSG